MGAQQSLFPGTGHHSEGDDLNDDSDESIERQHKQKKKQQKSKDGEYVVPFTEEQLQEYVDCTFFTPKEIIKVHKRFVLYSKTKPDRLTKEEFFAMPEFKFNPLRERIIAVFAQNDDGDLYFEDFLDFLSVFSRRAGHDVKASYVFRLYDLDGDGYLGDNDIRHVVDCMTYNLTEDEKTEVISKLFDEGDSDGNRQISYIEFEVMLKKSEDFLRNCRMSIF